MAARRASQASLDEAQNGAASELAARSVACIGCLFLLACEPLIATVGVDRASLGDVDAALPDAGEPPSSPDATVQDADATPDADAQAEMPDAGSVDVFTVDRTPKNCINLPDLIDLSDGGAGSTRSVDNGVVWARFDKELGCPNVGNVITYGRVDGKPLILAGVSAAISWPASDRMGPSTLHPTNGPCDPVGIPPLFSIVFAGLPGCHPNVQAAQYLRAQLATPSPHPTGFTLCENACGH